MHDGNNRIMKKVEEIKKRLAALKPSLQKRYGITDIGIFGSYARGEERPDSDLDVYVDYAEIPSLLDIVDLELFLNEELKVKTDVVPRECIRPELKKYILPEVVKI
jgi:predicted nucleotidyltransferase